jgi:hypothetical protein
MDQSIVRAVLAPTKLAWKNQVGRDLDASYDINKSEAATFAGAMTAEVTFSGQLEGRTLFVLGRVAAKNVESIYGEAFDEAITDKTVTAVEKLMAFIVVNIPKLLATAGYECTAELSSVAETTGKGVSNATDWPGVASLITPDEFAIPDDTDQINIWVDVTHMESKKGLSGDQKEILNGIREDRDSDQDTRLYQGDINGLTIAEVKRAKLRGEIAGGNVVRTLETLADDDIHILPEVKAGIVSVERLELVGEDGKSRTILSTTEDGSPFLSMADAEGHIRTTFRLDDEGNATLIFADEIGAETWVAPRDLPPELEPADSVPMAPPMGAPPIGGPPPSAGPMHRRPPPPPGRGPGGRPPPGQRPPPGRRRGPPGRKPAPGAGRRPAPTRARR